MGPLLDAAGKQVMDANGVPVYVDKTDLTTSCFHPITTCVAGNLTASFVTFLIVVGGSVTRCYCRKCCCFAPSDVVPVEPVLPPQPVQIDVPEKIEKALATGWMKTLIEWLAAKNGPGKAWMKEHIDKIPK